MARKLNSLRPLCINLLGGFHATGPRSRDVLLLERKKTRALLALLALEPAKALPRGKLTAMLWSEDTEDTARHGLRQCLLDLRHALARLNVEVLLADGDRVGLDANRLVVDVVRFERCLTRDTREALEEAIGLYHGDVLEGFSVDEGPFEEWLQFERQRIRARAIEALRKLLAHHVRSKNAERGVQVALRLLALEPFDETAHRALMQFYLDTDRRTAALRQYEACVEILARELGVEPQTETRELYLRLVAHQNPGPKTPARSHGSYKSQPRAARPCVLAEAANATPFVGRDAEGEWLIGLREAASVRRPQLGLVLGEAGIGKSRLVGELIAAADRDRWLVLLGRGREGEDVLPFAPWTEALRPALNADLLDCLAPVTRLDLARLFPEIAGGHNVPSSGLEDGPRIFEAVAHLLRALSVRRRVVVVIEDLHWCDDMTVRLLRFLPRRLEGRGVLLLGTARDEDIPIGRGAVLDALRLDASCAVRALGPLSRDEATRLFRASLTSRDSPPSAALAERMWRLSEGNPFVVIQYARAVHDHGGDRDEAATLGLPDQVRALTARGLARLSDRAARLTDVAAVIGRDFDVAVLRYATSLSDLEMAEGVEELVRRRILREVGGRFDFIHDRVREVAYAGLLVPRRALLHRQVAEALEAVYSGHLDPHRVAIGAHYREAGIWDRASTYLARAGFQAWDRGAGREALACFEAALETIARLPDEAERRELHVHLRLAANGASVASGSVERGLAHLEVAAGLAETLADRRWRGRVAVVLGNAYRVTEALDRALTCTHFALDVARETEDRGLEAAARTILAYTEYNKGNFRRSIDVVQWVLSDEACCPGVEGPFLSYVDKRSWMRALTRFLMIMNCVHLGDFASGARLAEQSFQEIDRAEDPLGTSHMLAHTGLGKLCLARGDYCRAVQAFNEALAIYRDDCHRNYYRPLGWSAGLANALGGRVDEGVKMLEKAAESERHIGSRVAREHLLLHTGRAYIEAGRLDDAARCAGDALEWARKTGRGMSEAGAHGLLGEVAMHRDRIDVSEMECHVRASLRLAENLEMRPLAARCHLRLAWLAERTGAAGREDHASEAQSLVRSMDGVVGLEAAGLH
jgi:DNA-binding SARP family transcriptional activator/tetratricopeptide (TPR) repeat protein